MKAEVKKAGDLKNGDLFTIQGREGEGIFFSIGSAFVDEEQNEINIAIINTDDLTLYQMIKSEVVVVHLGNLAKYFPLIKKNLKEELKEGEKNEIPS